jgi:protocatechuate 3,4-dioxygenase beta subunit
MSAGKWKAMAALLLILGLIAGGVLTRAQTPAEGSAKPSAPPPPPKEPAHDVTVTGRVLGPDGQPLAGAKVSLVTNAVKTKADLAVRATTDKEGRFRFTARQADVERGAKVLAQARGLGPDWVKLTALPRAREVTLRLVKDDLPLTGRVLDLEGHPIAGVTAHVLRLGKTPGGEDLGPWLEKNSRMRSQGTYLNEDGLSVLPADVLDLPTTATTDKDGRWRLSGFGRDRVVRLNIEGPTIVWRKAWAVTRRGPARGFVPGRDSWDVYAAHFEYLAAPCKPIAGTVREKGTGIPLAGILVGSAMHGSVETTTDKDGRYRIVGAAKNRRYCIVAEGESHFNCTKNDVADTPGLEPITVDFELERGVVIHGRLTDKATGRPVRGSVFWCARADNPHLKEYRDAVGILKVHLRQSGSTAADGSFHVLGIPGPGLLCARAEGGADFIAAQVPREKGEPVKYVPDVILEGYCHALIPVDVPEKGARSLRRDIALDPGRAVKGTVQGPDGRPLAGVQAAGLSSSPRARSADAPGREPLPSADFTVTGLALGQRRTVAFVHFEKDLGKVVRLGADEKGPLTVRLEPLGGVRGRMVNAAGKPWAGVTITVRPGGARTKPAEPVLAGSITLFERQTKTGEDGTFRVRGLLPGESYFLVATLGDPSKRGAMPVSYAEGLSAASGETKDLGDVKPKLPPGK